MDLSTYLDGLLQKQLIPSSELAHFLSEMRKTQSGPLITSKLLAAKIQSTCETQAIRAFNFLEAALSVEVEGSIEFRTEIGRYRFLNELIRIISPKYYGAKTILSVRERAVKFLTDAAGSKRKQWFPSEHSKIDAVYNSLVEGGIILPNAVDPDAEFQKSIFERGENAIMLKKLLQSKDPSDLQAANRLIKNLVDEEAKRNERRSAIHSLIDRIDTSTTLLTEMCGQSQIDREIVDELASTCRVLRNKLGDIGTETNEETNSLLHASENIENSLEYYEKRKDHVHVSIPQSHLIEHPSLDPQPQAQSSFMSLADELLMGMNLGSMTLQDTTKENNTVEISNNNTNDIIGSEVTLPNFIDFGVSQSQPMGSLLIEEKKASHSSVFDELGLISRQLMEESLTGKEVTSKIFTTERSSDKVTLNQMQQQNASLVQNIALSNPPIASNSIIPNSAASMELLDLNFLEKSSKDYNISIEKSKSIKTSTTEDESLLLVLDKDSTYVNTTLSNRKDNKCTFDDTPQESNFFSLDSVTDVDLEEIELTEDLNPINIPLDTISSNVDVKEAVELSFTFGILPGFPSSVKVAIITLTNRNHVHLLSDYGFQFLPPKGFQVKLFPPSSTELNPWKKKFLPPSVLTQIALILIPPGKNPKGVKLKFILSYYVGDETALYNSELKMPF